MKQKKKKQKFKPLSSATPEERYRAMELATYWVTDEVEGHTDSGAFSEAYLGEPARLFFPRKAYEKLKDPNSKWTWKEGTQLSTLMINVVKSEMAHKLREYKLDGKPTVVPASSMERDHESGGEDEVKNPNSVLEMDADVKRNDFDVMTDMEMLEELQRQESRRDRGYKIARAAAKESGDVKLMKYVEAVFENPDYRTISKKMKITQVEVKELEARLIAIFEIRINNK